MKRSLFVLSCWFLAPAAFAILDTNNNGVSDFWERDFNNGNLFDVSFDPQGDADGDGWTNAQEAEADTNPFHPNPPDGMIRPVTAHIPQVWSEPSEFEQSYLISPEAVTVTWPTIAGKLYALQFSSTLMQGSWLPVGDAFVAYGGETTYGFEVSAADKCFWRVSIADIDEDSDGLTNHEEFLTGTDSTIPDTDGDTLSDHAELTAGTDPLQADADGDGWTDPQELAAGTDSRNQDTDGDGIPDPIDTEALISAFAFADADGDGIADGNDPQPTTARGPAPSVASENASGNPLSNLIKDEIVKFVLTVSNPAGPAPTASNLTFFLNGAEEPATITAIGTPIGSSQRFLLTWAAKTTANYPTLTLQNLTLRFRDSQQATSWLKLARIDVAEWEGKMITLPFVSSEESWGYEVMTHQNGLKKKATLVSRNNASNMVYRGPKTMKVTNMNGGTSDLQLPEFAIPYLKISGSAGSPPNVVAQQDYATLATSMDVDFVFNNGSAKSLQFELDPAGINATLSPGQSNFDSVSLVNAVLPLGTGALIRYLDGTDWRPFYSTYWPVANTAGANSRILRSVNVLTTAAGQLKLHGVTNFMDRDAKITPYAPGTLDYPGLPQESVTSEYDQKYMATSSEEWRKIVIKIYPPQQHFTYSKGYRLTIGTGTTGDAVPQTGWMAQTQSGGALTALTIPTDGKIEILATDTNLYPRLTSPEGLVLFLKRDAAVDQVHILSVDILPIVETNTPVRLGALSLLPVEVAVDADRGGEITFDGNDQTTVEKPFRFWVNNDQDDVEADEPILVENPDSFDNEVIQTKRDLEDFCRLKLHVGLSNQTLRDGDFQIGLMFKGSSGVTPGIRIWKNQSNDGNLDYLKDHNAATTQIALGAFEKFPPLQVTLIPKDYWIGRNDSTAHLIFEGTSKGKGELIVTIHDKFGKILSEGAGIWMDLLDVRQMYQRARVANDAEQIPSPATNSTPPDQTWNWDPWSWPYSEDLQATEKTVIFVHGWRLKYMDYMNWSDTSYKRLWHQGFKGKFYSFRWATFSGDNNGLPYGFDENIEGTAFPPGGTTYNASEYRAWLCGTTLASFVNQLPNAGNRSLFAHSMGNVIAGAALRTGMLIDRYAMCNAAMAAMAYDPDPILRNVDKIFLPGTIPELQDTPDTDPDPAIRANYGLENKFNFSGMPDVFNFGLPDDSALGSWSANNLFFKPNTQYLYTENSILQPSPLVYQAAPVSSFRSVTAVPEAMGYVTKSRTRAAGAELRTNGVIAAGNKIDMENWFADTHSAQWRWSNHSTKLFWEELFSKLELKEENQ